MARIMVGKLTLWPVLWLVSYHYVQFYDWLKITIMASFMVGKLP